MPSYETLSQVLSLNIYLTKVKLQHPCSDKSGQFPSKAISVASALTRQLGPLAVSASVPSGKSDLEAWAKWPIYSVFISITNRYFTSPLSIRSYAWLIFCIGISSMSETMLFAAQ
jgi:hypothetical protein